MNIKEIFVSPFTRVSLGCTWDSQEPPPCKTFIPVD